MKQPAIVLQVKANEGATIYEVVSSISLLNVETGEAFGFETHFNGVRVWHWPGDTQGAVLDRFFEMAKTQMPR